MYALPRLPAKTFAVLTSLETGIEAGAENYRLLVSRVRGQRSAPDATEATAQVYFGIFSPTRATYRVDLPRYRAENAAGALEVMSRWAIDPWIRVSLPLRPMYQEKPSKAIRQRMPVSAAPTHTSRNRVLALGMK